MTDSMAEIVDLPSAERQARQPRARYGERALIVCDNLVKIYKVADLEVVALQGLDLLVESGEFIALVGASGSGKSTLLNVLGGLDVPSAGRATVAGYQLAELGPQEQTRYLRQVIGFVWQQTGRNLLPYLSALENVALPMAFDGVPADIRATRARELLRQVGLEERVDHRPQHLSGGEQQRVAIAVALANEPEVILADEPTGELDSGSAAEIFELLRRLNRELGVTIVVATHDPLVSSQVEPDRLHPRRSGQQRGPAPPGGSQRGGSPHRDGVRGPRSRRSPAAAARPRRGARARETGARGSRGGPHQRVAGSERWGRERAAAAPDRPADRGDAR